MATPDADGSPAVRLRPRHRSLRLDARRGGALPASVGRLRLEPRGPFQPARWRGSLERTALPTAPRSSDAEVAAAVCAVGGIPHPRSRSLADAGDAAARPRRVGRHTVARNAASAPSCTSAHGRRAPTLPAQVHRAGRAPGSSAASSRRRGSSTSCATAAPSPTPGCRCRGGAVSKAPTTGSGDRCRRALAAEWEESGRSFVVLAGLLWQLLIDSFDSVRAAVGAATGSRSATRTLRQTRVETFASMLTFCGLPWDAEFERGFERHTFTASRSDAFRRDLAAARRRAAQPHPRGCARRASLRLTPADQYEPRAVSSAGTVLARMYRSIVSDQFST